MYVSYQFVGNIRSVNQAMIKYYVSQQVQNWDAILLLGLEILICHIMGQEMSRFTRFLWVNFQMLENMLV